MNLDQVLLLRVLRILRLASPLILIILAAPRGLNELSLQLLRRCQLRPKGNAEGSQGCCRAVAAATVHANRWDIQFRPVQRP